MNYSMDVAPHKVVPSYSCNSWNLKGKYVIHPMFGNKTPKKGEKEEEELASNGGLGINFFK